MHNNECGRLTVNAVGKELVEGTDSFFRLFYRSKGIFIVQQEWWTMQNGASCKRTTWGGKVFISDKQLCN